MRARRGSCVGAVRRGLAGFAQGLGGCLAGLGAPSSEQLPGEQLPERPTRRGTPLAASCRLYLFALCSTRLGAALCVGEQAQQPRFVHPWQ